MKHLYLYFQLIQVINIICTQVMTDIFFLDWERPREIAGKANGKNENNAGAKCTAPVSIWRTYFIANEWNELQVTRRINLAIQLLSVLFFLKVWALLRCAQVA